MSQDELFKINQYIKSVEKEAVIRAKWNKLHEAEIKKAATLKREPTNYNDTDALKYILEAGMPTLGACNNYANRNRRTKPIEDTNLIQGIRSLRREHNIADMGLGDPKDDPKLVRPDTDLRTDRTMRPVEPNLRKQLYKTIPHRASYLAARNDLIPEEKYYFCECSNWQYGWRMSDSKLLQMEMRKDRFGCKYETQKFYTSIGPQPDPKHYRSAHEIHNTCGLAV